MRDVGVFLQARVGSTRLPGKVLLPLSGRPVVEHAMLSLNNCGAATQVLVTDEPSSERLAPCARRCGFDLYVGPTDDVLARFAGAAGRFPVDHIVRATADNPLVSSELVVSLMALHRRHHADFSGYVGMPLGLGVEIIRTTALFVEHEEAVDPYEREHVNPFLYRRPARFAILRPEVPACYRLPDRSVTLDTAEDYRYLSRLFKELYDGRPIGIARLLQWLTDNPRDDERGGWRAGQARALHSVG